jgi:hypothetical protein
LKESFFRVIPQEFSVAGSQKVAIRLNLCLWECGRDIRTSIPYGTIALVIATNYFLQRLPGLAQQSESRGIVLFLYMSWWIHRSCSY